MKGVIATIGFTFLLLSSVFAGEQTVLARVTSYWRNEGSGQRAAWNGERLRPGHCAVDPRKIPYGSKVVFPDVECLAVDSGPAVVSGKPARYCGRSAAEKNAIVVDRFFETRQDAVSWSSAHPQFMALRIITPDTLAKNKTSDRIVHNRPELLQSDRATMVPGKARRVGKPALLSNSSHGNKASPIGNVALANNAIVTGNQLNRIGR